jgi:hypothetical protein
MALNAAAQKFWTSMSLGKQAELSSTFISLNPVGAAQNWLNGYIDTINKDGYTLWTELSSDQQKSLITNHQITGGPSLGSIGIPNPLSGINAVGDFFQRLTQGSTWIRIAEVVIGFLLLTVGLSKLTGINPAKAIKAVV